MASSPPALSSDQAGPAKGGEGEDHRALQNCEVLIQSQ
jgi:hypothetical protein